MSELAKVRPQQIHAVVVRACSSEEQTMLLAIAEKAADIDVQTFMQSQAESQNSTPDKIKDLIQKLFDKELVVLEKTYGHHGTPLWVLQLAAEGERIIDVQQNRNPDAIEKQAIEDIIQKASKESRGVEISETALAHVGKHRRQKLFQRLVDEGVLVTEKGTCRGCPVTLYQLTAEGERRLDSLLGFDSRIIEAEARKKIFDAAAKRKGDGMSPDEIALDHIGPRRRVALFNHLAETGWLIKYKGFYPDPAEIYKLNPAGGVPDGLTLENMV